MILYNSSALPRIVTCPGSVGLVAQAPRTDDTDSSAEGTAFHHFAALLLNNGVTEVGDRAPNGHVMDVDMYEHASEYARVMRTDPSWVARVEAAMHWGPGGKAHDGQPWQVRVRCDAVTWRPDIRTLAVTDAKYGFRYVDVQDNWQLLSQAIGACFALNIQPERIILAIYQPRGPGDTLRWVEITPQELLAAYSFLCDRLGNITDELQTSDHCRHCPAIAGCPAHERATFAAIDVAMSGSNFNVNEAGMRARLDLLDRAEEFIKQHKKAVEAAALAALRDGRPVPGLSTKVQLGNTRWRDNVSVTDLRLLGNNFIEEVPVTPAEAKRRGLPQEEYDKLTHRPTTGVKLIRGDGAAEAAKVFGEQKPKRTRKK